MISFIAYEAFILVWCKTMCAQNDWIIALNYTCHQFQCAFKTNHLIILWNRKKVLFCFIIIEVKLLKEKKHLFNWKFMFANKWMQMGSFVKGRHIVQLTWIEWFKKIIWIVLPMIHTTNKTGEFICWFNWFRFKNDLRWWIRYESRML